MQYQNHRINDLKYNTLDATLQMKSDTHIRGFKDFLVSVKSYDALVKTTRQLLRHKLQTRIPKCPLGPREVCACVFVCARERLWEGHCSLVVPLFLSSPFITPQPPTVIMLCPDIFEREKGNAGARVFVHACVAKHICLKCLCTGLTSLLLKQSKRCLLA